MRTSETTHNAKHIRASAHRCFSGLVGPPKEDAATESDRTQYVADKPAHKVTGTPPLRLCTFGVCVCESVESSCVLLRLMYFTADLFHLTAYVCEINLCYE
jgi:hypothetical protein